MARSVLVGLSGGVDSAVAAACLKEQGYEVYGVTLVMFGAIDSGPTVDSIRDAAQVAERLEIRHEVIELQGAFSDTVINYFVNEYSRGRTPNPCVFCNRFFKFEILLKVAREKGLDMVATGHYARVEHDPETQRHLIYKGIDSSKDQSYFLYLLTQEQLAKAIFPLGILTKAQSRELAATLGLKVAEKTESQEICFVPEQSYSDFLQAYIGRRFESGPIMNRAGKQLGTHKGIIHYTVGQRRGLGVAAPEPLYVLEIKPDENIIVVGYEPELARNEIDITDCNYIPFDELAKPCELSVKVRYRGKGQAALVSRTKSGAHISFFEPLLGVAPGQAAVFYDDDLLIGGGTIG